MQQPFSNPNAGSLAEMAQRDLDAALELLADRAQYITGATGAAIALRREGKKDMQCRARTGSNAPELGTLFSTEFGLSGESVRTRKPLRCDDAERDGRVNREVCRRLGIASVVVMPVVHDDEVLGVFELFSGKAHAFADRDLSAVRRLSEMVETAVRLAETTQKLPQQLKLGGISVKIENQAAAEEPILEGEVIEDVFLEEAGEEIVLDEVLVEADQNQPELRKDAVTTQPAEPPQKREAATHKPVDGNKNEKKSEPVTSGKVAEPAVTAATETSSARPVSAKEPVQEKTGAGPIPAEAAKAAAASAEKPVAPVKKPLYWSASENVAEAPKEEAEQIPVPPVMRNLRKCHACGFPVSAERMLCVECEEKKWRGQLRAQRPVATSAAVAVPVPAKSERALAAQAAAGGVAVPAAQRPGSSPEFVAAGSEGATTPPRASTTSHVCTATATTTQKASGPDFVLSAGIAPSQSWFSRNKYVIGVLLVAAAVVVAIVFLR